LRDNFLNKEQQMGLFSKPTVQIDNDEEIRREIRARVAKQVGIYDEEYINTGKIGGIKVEETPLVSSAPTPVIEADATDAVLVAADVVDTVPSVSIPVITEIDKGETELTLKPVKVKSTPEKTPAKQNKPAPPAKQATPIKPVGKKNPSKAKKAKKKKNINMALILIILVLIIAFIPFYYYLTGVGAL
jgi:hypothetical protein